MRHPGPIRRLLDRIQNNRTGAAEPASPHTDHPSLGTEWDVYEGADDTEAGKLAVALLQMIGAGSLDDLDTILAEDVTYLVPGRGHAAGLHHGQAAVTAALTQPPAPNVQIAAAEPTELLATTDRAVVIVAVTGSRDDNPFVFETVLHLQSRDGLIVAITEYSGDQHLADAIVGSRSGLTCVDAP